jgi:hypothetical protein
VNEVAVAFLIHGWSKRDPPSDHPPHGDDIHRRAEGPDLVIGARFARSIFEERSLRTRIYAVSEKHKQTNDDVAEIPWMNS